MGEWLDPQSIISAPRSASATMRLVVQGDTMSVDDDGSDILKRDSIDFLTFLADQSSVKKPN